jgi:hypothetical protein
VKDWIGLTAALNKAVVHNILPASGLCAALHKLPKFVGIVTDGVPYIIGSQNGTVSPPSKPMHELSP